MWRERFQGRAWPRGERLWYIIAVLHDGLGDAVHKVFRHVGIHHQFGMCGKASQSFDFSVICGIGECCNAHAVFFGNTPGDFLIYGQEADIRCGHDVGVFIRGFLAMIHVHINTSILHHVYGVGNGQGEEFRSLRPQLLPAYAVGFEDETGDEFVVAAGRIDVDSDWELFVPDFLDGFNAGCFGDDNVGMGVGVYVDQPHHFVLHALERFHALGTHIGVDGLRHPYL